MSELEWKWAFFSYLDAPEKQHESAVNAGYVKVVLKSEADKVIAELEENHKKEVERLQMKIAGLEKLVDTADKLLKQKGGFTVKDITFDGVKLEGMNNEP